MRYMLNRLGEASTWAGISGAITAASQAAQGADPATAVMVGVASLAAVFLPGGRRGA